jgi:hypothetical protein
MEGDGEREKVRNEPPPPVYDVIEATFGHLLHPYESYSLPYMVNRVVSRSTTWFKVNHPVQGQPRTQHNLLYWPEQEKVIEVFG